MPEIYRMTAYGQDSLIGTLENGEPIVFETEELAVRYVPERTCRAEHGLEYDDELDMWTVKLTCGHIVHPFYNYIPKFCEECGSRVDGYGAEVVGHKTRNMSDKENACEGCVIPNRDYGHAPSPCNFCARNDEERYDLYTPAKVVE